MLRSSRLPRPGPAVLLLVCCLAVPACAKGKLTKANYEKIQTGMTLQQVEELLGPGTKDEGGDGSGVAAQFGVDVSGGAGPARKSGDTYVWESGTTTITVDFQNGKVTGKHSKGL
jgi:hypothetical protein